MAKVVGLIGSGHGKLGNTVMAVRRGVQIARVYQPKVSNPKSARQEFSREKMSLAVRTLRPFTNALRAGWSLQHPTYEFQKGVSIAIPAGNEIISGTPNNLAVDEGALATCLSAPLLEAISVTNLNFSNANQVTMNVQAPESAYLDNGGNVIHVGAVVVVWNKDAGACVTKYMLLNDNGQATTVDVKMPELWSGMTVYVYAFAKQIPDAINGISVDKLPWRYPAKTSPAVYAGTGTIA